MTSSKVELLQIGNFVYRQTKLNPSHESFSTNSTSSKRVVEDDDDDEDVDDKFTVSNSDNDDLDIQEKDGMYSLPFQLDRDYHRFLVGSKGIVKKRLEAECNATLEIPGVKSKDTTLFIRANNRDNVVKLKEKVDALLEEKARTSDKLQYTHFLSIPIELQSGEMASWRKEVCAKYANTRGFHKSMLVSPKRYHLTLLMLRLPSDSMVKKATTLLEELSQQVYDAVDTRSLVCRFEGLGTFQTDYSNVSVLFAKPFFEGDAKVRVERMARLLIEQFKKAKLAAVSESDVVKWHLTLFNARYRNSECCKDVAKSLDGTEMLANYMDYEFGLCRLGAIHLSKRFEDDPSNGYYKRETQILLPCAANERLK